MWFPLTDPKCSDSTLDFHLTKYLCALLYQQTKKKTLTSLDYADFKDKLTETLWKVLMLALLFPSTWDIHIWCNIFFNTFQLRISPSPNKHKIYTILTVNGLKWHFSITTTFFPIHMLAMKDPPRQTNIHLYVYFKFDVCPSSFTMSSLPNYIDFIMWMACAFQ